MLSNLSGLNAISDKLEQKTSSLIQEFNFDLAYINDIYAELPEGSGVGLVAESYGLLINTGSIPITKEDLESAGVVIKSNVEGVSLEVGFNADNQFQPIQPHYAWGSVDSQNLFLVDLLEEGEILQNMTPYQTISLGVFRDNYSGVAVFNVSILIRDRVINLETTVTFVNSSEYILTLNSGEREDSSSHPNQPPITPTISGPYYGNRNTNYTFFLDSINDPDEDQIYVLWDWGDGDDTWLGPYNSGVNVSASHAWYETGNYYIQVFLEDVHGIQSDKAIHNILIGITPPYPPQITGPAIGKPGNSYNYTFITNDPDYDWISLWINWGDNTSSEWFGPYPSGTLVNQSHTWAIKGTYIIKAKAKDIHGNESDWGQLSVTMPSSYNVPMQWLWERFFQRFPHTFPILRYLIGCMSED